jgi:hypothetical protein
MIGGGINTIGEDNGKMITIVEVWVNNKVPGTENIRRADS